MKQQQLPSAVLNKKGFYERVPCVSEEFKVPSTSSVPLESFHLTQAASGGISNKTYADFTKMGAGAITTSCLMRPAVI